MPSDSELHQPTQVSQTIGALATILVRFNIQIRHRRGPEELISH